MVEKIGADVTDYRVGQKVMAVAPHAEYAVKNVFTESERLCPVADDVSFEEVTFLPLATTPASEYPIIE